MADSRATDLTAISTPAAGDKIYIVDVSDTSENAAGSSRQITLTNLFAQVDEINTDLATLTGSQVLTNKTINLASNTLTGTIAEFNTALSDANFATLTGIETLTNKTLTTPALNSPIITTGDLNGTELIIDADADTSITADTDDQIDFKVGGSDAFRMKAADFDLAGTTPNITVAAADPWRTVSIFGGMKPTTTAPCASKTTIEAGTQDIDYDVLDFDSATDENAFVNFQMPDSWDGGVIQFRYVWTNAGGGAAETVTFELSARAYADSDAIDQAVGTAVEVADTWLAQGDIHLSAWSGNVTVAGTAPAGGQWVHFEVMRDVSEDSLTGDARLLDLEIRYKQATFSD